MNDAQERRHARYLLANKEKAKQQAYEWRMNHPETMKASRRKFLDSHKEHLQRYEATRYANNRETMAAKNKEWRDSHPIQRAQNEAKHRAVVRGVVVDSVDYMAVLKRDGWNCHICGKAVTQGTLSFDHVIPMSKDGPHHESNIRVAHRSCNSRKGNRVDWPRGGDTFQVVWQ